MADHLKPVETEETSLPMHVALDHQRFDMINTMLGDIRDEMLRIRKLGWLVIVILAGILGEAGISLIGKF